MTELDVADLIEPPEGTIKVGDECLDPSNWQQCPACSSVCPAESETCFDCGATL